MAGGKETLLHGSREVGPCLRVSDGHRCSTTEMRKARQVKPGTRNQKDLGEN